MKSLKRKINTSRTLSFWGEVVILVTFSLLIVFVSYQLSAAEPVGISGLTEPLQDSELGLSITGRITAIKVAEGEEVKKGQLLLQLDQDLESLEVKRRKLLWESKVEIESVTRQVQTLRNHLNATRDLYQSTGSVPREDLENKELEHAFAVAELNRLNIAEQREQIEYNTAKRQLAKRNLYAPFSGTIAEVLSGVGENCEVDTPLLRLVDSSQGYFVANVELPLSQQMELGDKVELRFDSGQETVRKAGEIFMISPLVDPASGLRKIKALFDNQDHQVVPGMAGLMMLSNRTDTTGTAATQ